MLAPGLPADEAMRLRALHELKLLDTSPEERFDRLTRLAKRMFDVPIALISLVDEHRQWFKSRQGLDACETGRDISFCGHAILGQDVLLVTDATKDPRFADNPLVTGAPHIRFYAGAPLHTVDGYRLGTLCLIDSKPRVLTRADIAALRDLADCVESETNRLVESHLHTLLAKNREELTRLSRVASQTTNGVVITGVDGRVEWINEGFTRITGYALEEMRGRRPGRQLQGAGTDPETVRQIRSALQRGEGFEVDLLNYAKSGRPYWIRIQCSPLYDDDGRLQGFMAIESDITQHRQAVEALELSEARLRGLFELSPIGIALNDYESGAFLELNDALLQPTGYTREEFVSLSYWDLTPEEYRPEEIQQLRNMEKTGRYGPYEKEYIRKDGSRYPVLLTGMVIHDSGRKLIWSMIEDISERRRAERMKSEFVSTVSHELRTPLTSISGALRLVVGGAVGELPGQALEMVGIAHRNSQRLMFLINDLLDMEKIAAGKMHFEMQAQPLMPLVELSLESHRPYGDEQEVALALDSPRTDVEVRVDSQRLQQVMANLLSNAIKFSPQCGTVVVSVQPGAETVRIAIADTGPGIPEAFRSRIFEKFSQADASDTRPKGGSGLGLAISRELVERMGGHIGFDSVVDEGATFWFELPLCGRRASPAGQAPVERIHPRS